MRYSRQTKNSLRVVISLLFVAVYASSITVLPIGKVQALTQVQKDIMDSGARHYNEEISQKACGPTGGSGSSTELPASIPDVWRSLIMAAAPLYPDVDPRLVASVLWAENRGWPQYRTTGWASSSVGAQGPWQFMPATWAGMGTDGNGDGKKDPNDPADAVHGAFKHHAGSAGKPIAANGFDASATPEQNFQTVVFERTATNLLYYAAKYNGRGAPNGVKLLDFQRGQNSDYVIINYWLLATNFEQGWHPERRELINAATAGAPTGPAAPGAPTVCPVGGQLVGDVAWPVAKSFYDSNPIWFTKPHHHYPAADIPVETGTEVYATLAGQVTQAPTGGACGIGVVIDSPPNISITYCHGSDGGSVEGARQGDQVTAGQLIMHSASTGHSSGPHLHFGVRIDGESRCPQPLFEAMASGSKPDFNSLPSSGCTN